MERHRGFHAQEGEEAASRIDDSDSEVAHNGKTAAAAAAVVVDDDDYQGVSYPSRCSRRS